MTKSLVVALFIGPFVASSFASAPLSAKPKSQCNVLTQQAECEALKVADINLCQWIAPQTYTANGQRKAYCRMSGKSITKEQFESLQQARNVTRSGASAPAQPGR
jgi:hypothetical protein